MSSPSTPLDFMFKKISKCCKVQLMSYGLCAKSLLQTKITFCIWGILNWKVKRILLLNKYWTKNRRSIDRFTETLPDLKDLCRPEVLPSPSNRPWALPFKISMWRGWSSRKNIDQKSNRWTTVTFNNSFVGRQFSVLVPKPKLNYSTNRNAERPRRGNSYFCSTGPPNTTLQKYDGETSITKT